VRLLGGASQPELHSGDCVKAVQALASSAPHVMMRLRDATLRAAAANKVALKAEQEKEAAEKEKEDLQRELCGKRPRPEASTIEANEEMPADVSDLDLADWRRHATKWRNRSQVQLGSREDALAPRTGKNGYVDHPRLGLIGCLAYWARGSMAHAVSMIASLCVKLGISERVRDTLPETRATCESQTNVKIVALLKTGLGELKYCRNEQQRIQFIVGLSLVIPPRTEEGDSKGWIRRITDALGVKCGKRTAKYDARPYASDLAVDYRAQFDRDVELHKQPLKVGDMALLHGDSCVLTSISGAFSDYGEEGPPCVLTFHEGDVSQEYSYESMYGCRAGSARAARAHRI